MGEPMLMEPLANFDKTSHPSSDLAQLCYESSYSAESTNFSSSSSSSCAFERRSFFDSLSPGMTLSSLKRNKRKRQDPRKSDESSEPIEPPKVSSQEIPHLSSNDSVKDEPIDEFVDDSSPNDVVKTEHDVIKSQHYVIRPNNRIKSQNDVIKSECDVTSYPEPQYDSSSGVMDLSLDSRSNQLPSPPTLIRMKSEADSSDSPLDLTSGPSCGIVEFKAESPVNNRQEPEPNFPFSLPNQMSPLDPRNPIFSNFQQQQLPIPALFNETIMNPYGLPPKPKRQYTPRSKSDQTSPKIAPGPKAYKSSPNGQKETIACTVCSKRFKTWAYIKDHMRLHTGEKPFHCKYCPASFPNKSHLNYHVKSKHHVLSETAALIQSGDTLKCGLCQRQFNSRSALTLHAKRCGNHQQTVQNHQASVIASSSSISEPAIPMMTQNDCVSIVPQEAPSGPCPPLFSPTGAQIPDLSPSSISFP